MLSDKKSTVASSVNEFTVHEILWWLTSTRTINRDLGNWTWKTLNSFRGLHPILSLVTHWVGYRQTTRPCPRQLLNMQSIKTFTIITITLTITIIIIKTVILIIILMHLLLQHQLPQTGRLHQHMTLIFWDVPADYGVYTFAKVS